MISVLIETTLHSLTNVTILVDLPTFPRNVIERELAPLLLFAVPRLALLKDRFQPRAADPSIELAAHPMTLLEELQARILANSGSGSANILGAKSAQTTGFCLDERDSFAPAVSDVKTDH
jgi:hypothetical protein